MTALASIADFGLVETWDVQDPEVIHRADIDKMQYNHNDFSFWSKSMVDRSVKRHLLKPTDFADSLRDVDYKVPDYQEEIDNDSVISFPAVFNARLVGEKSVNTMQEWECVVEDVTENTVFAMGRALIDGSGSTEFLEIPLEEFSPDDKDILSAGIVFRFVIGWVRKPNNMRVRQSLIYVRRHLPKKQKTVDELFDLLSPISNALET